MAPLAAEEAGEVEWGALISEYGVSLISFVCDHAKADAQKPNAWSHPTGLMIKSMFEATLGKYIKACIKAAADRNVTFHRVVLVLDGATCHHTNAVKSAVSRIGVLLGVRISMKKTPARSPDLNPIEDVWHMLKTLIRKKHFYSLNEFRSVIEQCWKSLVQDKEVQIMKLAAGFPARCRKVIAAGGFFTR